MKTLRGVVNYIERVVLFSLKLVMTAHKNLFFKPMLRFTG